MTRNRTLIVPLGRDAASRFLPVIFGLMVYLAGLALAAVLVLSGMVEQVSQQGIDQLTVEVPPDESGETNTPASAVLERLRANPAIAEARFVSDAEVAALLQPWLGADGMPDDLALPQLIDVRLAPGATLDPSALATELNATAPGVRVDDPKIWLDRIGTFGRALALVAAVVVALVVVATAIMTVVSTRMALAVHQDVVELLHLMGARDTFISVLFQVQALKVGLIGGIAGAALAAGTLFGLEQAAKHLDATVLIDLRPAPSGYIAVVALALAAALIAMVTARFAALRALKRLA